jgi:glycosyltransferase involved in cell wall biosynthesis
MKILLINNCHYRRGGADVVYLNTGELLTKLGHEVYYFSKINKNNHSASTSGYFINEINYFGKSLLQKVFSVFRFFYSIEAKNKISQLLNDLQPEVAHVHLYKGDLTPSILHELKKQKVPVVISLHDYGMLCPHNIMLDGKMNICNRCVNGSALNCVFYRCNRNNLILSCLSSFEYIFHKTFFPFEKYFNKIITVSKFGQNLHQESGKFQRKVDHLYNFYPNLKTIEACNTKGVYFLYFGRLSREKGVKTLFSAWLNKERNHVLKVVGNGEMFDELQKMAFGNKSIEMLGFKSGSELNILIREASFVIVPSEWYENNPLTIIEAYANGKPVIGSNIGGIPEIIDKGNTGYLFEMKSIKELSAKISFAEAIDEYEYARLSSNARKYAENYFSPETHYDILMKFYQQTIIDNNQ